MFQTNSCSEKRAIIETVNDELKNIAQGEHSRHRCFDNFIVNLLSDIVSYCCFQRSRVSIYKRLSTHSLLCFGFGKLTLYLGLSDQIKKFKEITKQKSIKIEFIKIKR